MKKLIYEPKHLKKLSKEVENKLEQQLIKQNSSLIKKVKSYFTGSDSSK